MKINTTRPTVRQAQFAIDRLRSLQNVAGPVDQDIFELAITALESWVIDKKGQEK